MGTAVLGEKTKKIKITAKWLENKNCSTDWHRGYCCCGRHIFKYYHYTYGTLPAKWLENWNSLYRPAIWIVRFWEKKLKI
jgi:hypothetical protein